MAGSELGTMNPHLAKDSLWLRLVVFYQHCHPERLKDSILDEVKRVALSISIYIIIICPFFEPYYRAL